MGVTRRYTLQDKRGYEMEANVADCVNAKRTPQLRERILNGDFHRVPDPSGPGGRVTVEKTFFYSDFGRQQFFLVLPRWDRRLWWEASNDLREMMAHFPESLAPSGRRKFRLVFGLAELREKLLAYDAELSDELLEVLKVILLSEHPFLLDRPRLNLVLNRVTTEMVEFVATYDHDPERYRLGFSRHLVDELFGGREAELREWIYAAQAAVELKDELEPLWINMHRWSPSLLALTALDHYARLADAGKLPEEVFDTREFKLMLKNLPRGADLSAAAKQDLMVLRGWARRNGRNARDLWEVFYDKELTGKAAVLRPELVERLWNILDGVNPGQFEGNSFVDRIQLGVNDSASYYDPSTDDITINQATLPKGRAYEKGYFEQVVLHEVGHAVHEQHSKKVDKMLWQRFGWQRMSSKDEGIDQWVAAMGGYPANVTEVVKRQIRSYVRQSVGDGDVWVAPARPDVPRGHLWHTESFGPRLACESTTQRVKGKRWYDFSERWYQKGKRRFFVNFYYGELMTVSDLALNYVRKGALDPYALMAPPEFFAELYMTVHAKDEKLAARVELLDPKLVAFIRSLGNDDSQGSGDSPRAKGAARRISKPHPRPAAKKQRKSDAGLLRPR